MNKPIVNIVWFKRDLRVNDHQALSQAASSGLVLPIFCWEPSVWQGPDYATQHVVFVQECLASLKIQLAAIGLELYESAQGILATLSILQQHYSIAGIYSHEETGNVNSYEVDKSVAQWCKKQSCPWFEYPQNGVVRGLQDRDTWQSIWQKRMRAPIISTPSANQAPIIISHKLQPSTISAPHLNKPQADKPQRQRGGLAHASKVLHTFLHGRASHYRGGISSPLTAVDAGSRISPYLTWGVISVRQVMHALWEQYAKIKASPSRYPNNLAMGLAAFESRMHWHCHFIQKLETQVSIEHSNMHSAFNGMRDETYHHADSRERLARWQQGQTGWPIVDACMAMLRETGWINFRMRAMLISSASYLLWLHWRETGLFLASEFLDYEPGIHWPQVQMQSGTTGMNTLRIYNPIKQAHDQDSEGNFVRHWIPSLRGVPNSWIFEPWKMTLSLQQDYRCLIGTDYPAPMIAISEAIQQARAKIATARMQARNSPETASIIKKHASRKNSLRPKNSKVKSPSQRQQSLLF